MTTDQRAERALWLEWLTNVVPPVSLLVSLLVYFGWVRRIAYANELGFDPSLLQEATIPGYLMRSVGPLYLPLVGIATIALAAVGFAQVARFWLRDRRKSSRVRWAYRVLSSIVVVALLAVLVMLFLDPPIKAYAELVLPFALAATVIGLGYGLSLRRRMTHGYESRGNIAAKILAAFLVSLFLFAGVDGFAKVVGRGLAHQIIDEPEHFTYPVVLFSRYDLRLSPEDARKTATTSPDARSFGYRYDGLRLAFVDAGTYFLLPVRWQEAPRKVIVLKQDDLRLEFLR